jgi:hypothetical protein
MRGRRVAGLAALYIVDGPTPDTAVSEKIIE